MGASNGHRVLGNKGEGEGVSFVSHRISVGFETRLFSTHSKKGGVGGYERRWHGWLGWVVMECNSHVFICRH